MHKVFTIFLILWVMGIGLVINSCAKEETSSKVPEKDATVDIKSQALKPQTEDLASGNPISKSIYSDYNGKRIYFCCENSKLNFLEQNPAAYLQKAKELGIALEDVPAKK